MDYEVKVEHLDVPNETSSTTAKIPSMSRSHLSKVKPVHRKASLL